MKSTKNRQRRSQHDLISIFLKSLLFQKFVVKKYKTASYDKGQLLIMGQSRTLVPGSDFPAISRTMFQFNFVELATLP
jgi:hypothetical protein